MNEVQRRHLMITERKYNVHWETSNDVSLGTEVLQRSEESAEPLQDIESDLLLTENAHALA